MELRRVLGLRDLVLLFTLTCFAPRWVASAAEAGWSSLVVWLLAAAGLFVPLASAVLELSARHPDEGGLYVWTRRAFGDGAGFLAGFLYWASNLPFFPALLYFTAANALAAGGTRGAALSSSRGFFLVFSLAAIAVAAAANVRGLRVATGLHNAAAAATWAAALLLVAAGAAALVRSGPATPFRPSSLVPSLGLGDALFFATIAFAYGGLEAPSFLGAEMRDPRRDLPRAVLLSGALVTGVYVLGTAAVLVAVPAAEASGLDGITRALAAASARAGWPPLAGAGAALLALSGIGVTGAWLAASARLPFVAGVDRFLPPAFGRIDPRWGTPAVAILVQAVLSMAFVLLSQAGTGVKGAYDALVAMSVIAYFVPFLFLFAAAIRLGKEPAPEGAFRVPGGRPVSVALASVGFATTSAALALAFVPPAREGERLFAFGKLVVLTIFLFAGALGLWLAAKSRHDRAPGTAR